MAFGAAQQTQRCIFFMLHICHHGVPPLSLTRTGIGDVVAGIIKSNNGKEIVEPCWTCVFSSRRVEESSMKWLKQVTICRQQD
jgi:hypothetical protein